MPKLLNARKKKEILLTGCLNFLTDSEKTEQSNNFSLYLLFLSQKKYQIKRRGDFIPRGFLISCSEKAPEVQKVRWIWIRKGEKMCEGVHVRVDGN